METPIAGPKEHHAAVATMDLEAKVAEVAEAERPSSQAQGSGRVPEIVVALVLGGSWVVLHGLRSPLIPVISIVTLLIRKNLI